MPRCERDIRRYIRRQNLITKVGVDPTLGDLTAYHAACELIIPRRAERKQVVERRRTLLLKCIFTHWLSSLHLHRTPNHFVRSEPIRVGFPTPGFLCNILDIRVMLLVLSIGFGVGILFEFTTAVFEELENIFQFLRFCSCLDRRGSWHLWSSNRPTARGRDL